MVEERVTRSGWRVTRSKTCQWCCNGLRTYIAPGTTLPCQVLPAAIADQPPEWHVIALEKACSGNLIELSPALDELLHVNPGTPIDPRLSFPAKLNVNFSPRVVMGGNSTVRRSWSGLGVISLEELFGGLSSERRSSVIVF
jgi:hypothetical protein